MTRPYCSLTEQWPGGDCAATLLRYHLAASLVAGQRLLELGCGAGDGAPLLAASARDYTGLDCDPHWTGDDPAFLVGDAEELPEPWTGRFDRVVALELIEHLEHPDRLVAEIRRVLAPGGVGIVSTPNVALLSRGCDGSDEPLFEHHLREYTADGFREQLRSDDRPLTLVGLSHLATPDSSPDQPTLVVADRVVHLRLGPQPPELTIEKVETLPEPLPLEASQSFLALLGTDQPPTGALPSDQPSDLSVEEVCTRSFQWILQRRNDQVRQLQAALANRDQHIRKLRRFSWFRGSQHD